LAPFFPDRLPPRFAALLAEARPAARFAAFFAPFLAGFFAFLAVFWAGFFLAAFFAVFLAGLAAVSRAGRRAARGTASSAAPFSPAGSMGIENGFGLGAGGLSIGIGSIHPEPDQPISLKCSSAIVAPSEKVQHTHAAQPAAGRETRTRLPVNEI
jgi:hypothetical protein